MTERQRTGADAAYILHAQPYRETSLLLETFTRPQGRVAMVARGARRPRSELRGTLLAFHPLSLEWFGKGEVRTLAKAEWLGGQAFLRGEALLCGYYLNELLLRLLPREDAHERLFERYAQALTALAEPGASGQPAPVLRAFEKSLLAELGYALALPESGGAGINPETAYCYDPERGPVPAGEPAGAFSAVNNPVVSGQTLLDISRDDYGSARTQNESKALMRSLINHRLENAPLRSRRVYRELLELAPASPL